MEFDEAVARLGLTPPFTAKDVRRAYLRLLKVHKPESDPDGFMRLRQAYEMFEGVERVGPRASQAEPIEPIVDRPAADETSPAEVSPREPEADAAPETQPEAEAQPPEVDEATLPPWERAVPEDAKVAAVLLSEWLERAKSDPTAPPPPMGSALRLLWSMLDRRAFKTAGRLYRGMDEWLVQVGGARGELAWGMAQGMWEMRKDIPDELYSPMVRAVASESPGEAAEALRAFASDSPGAAGALQRKLAAQAPQLAAVFNGYLTPNAQKQMSQPTSRGSWANAWWVVPVLLGAMRLFRTDSSSKTGSGQPISRTHLVEQAARTAGEQLVSAADAAGWASMSSEAKAVGVALSSGDCQAAYEHVGACKALIERATVQQRAQFAELVGQLEAPMMERCSGRLQRAAAEDRAPIASAPPPVPASASATASARASAAPSARVPAKVR